MNVNHYIGFDVHKKSVSYCVKTADGRIVEEGKLPRDARSVAQMGGSSAEPWRGAMEATLFSGWIYDTLKPYAAELQMGHPALMKAIGASKKKNDKLDARKIADLVRCNLLPACYVAPPEMRELRRMLRYRNLVVRAGGAHEEQDERSADGSGRGVQQAEAARKEVFHGIAGHRGRSAGIGERSAAAEPGRDGDVRGDAAATARRGCRKIRGWPSG